MAQGVCWYEWKSVQCDVIHDKIVLSLFMLFYPIIVTIRKNEPWNFEYLKHLRMANEIILYIAKKNVFFGQLCCPFKKKPVALKKRFLKGQG